LSYHAIEVSIWDKQRFLLVREKTDECVVPIEEIQIDLPKTIKRCSASVNFGIAKIDSHSSRQVEE